MSKQYEKYRNNGLLLEIHDDIVNYAFKNNTDKEVYIDKCEQEAYSIVIESIESFIKNSTKLYNKDYMRATDGYCTKKYLIQLQEYIDNFYCIGKDNTEENRCIYNKLNKILNRIYQQYGNYIIKVSNRSE